MQNDRRRFLKIGLAGSAAMLAGCSTETSGEEQATSAATRSDGGAAGSGGPIILSTWDHGMMANVKAWKVMQGGGSVLDAVEQGVMVVEEDLSNRSVGLGGMPDRDGHTTLDACIQDHDSRAGSVAFVQRFLHPISIARAVMEKTPHVMLAGAGAERWASENGFIPREVPMAEEVKRAWKEWQAKNALGQDQPDSARVNIENHDTIGLIAMDAGGRLAGSCTTSGLAWKIHGRVGDSPIIGAGLFVDGDVGAACATGTGELVIRVTGSHSVVELMRQGMDPQEACKQVVERIIRKHPGLTGHQVGMLALRADGAHGAYSIYKGFNYALRTGSQEVLLDAQFIREAEKG